MTLMLASVTDADEAATVLSHGADIVDFKDPSKGALGALPAAVVRAAVVTIGRRRPTSAVTGDLPMRADDVVRAAQAMAATGVDYVKVGLFPDGEREECIRALAPLAQTTKIVGVMFADRGADNALVPLMAASGFAGAMLDTAGKGAGRLLDHLDVGVLEDFIAECRSHGLLAGLAGSLETPDIPRLLLLAPDFLGFRGALCAEQDRRSRIDAGAVGLVRELIPPDPRSSVAGAAPVSKADYQRLAARGYSVDPSAATDRIFVRDFVLPVRIGAYAHERAKPQNVRFNVDVKVLRSGRTAEDMRDVFSYDIVTDGIRMIVAHQHIRLVETLAERIAALVLASPRAVEVTVRVEKLDVGPGGVGVEIRRERPAEMASVHQLYPSGAGKAEPKAHE